MHDGLDVAFGLRCGIHLLQPVLNLNRLHPRDVGSSPLHANLLDDTQVGGDCRIAEFTVFALLAGAALLDFEQPLLLDEAIQKSVEGRLQNSKGGVF